MTRIKKHEDPLVARQIRFYDQYGKELTDVIELDINQGNRKPNGKRRLPNGDIVDCFFPKGTVVVDGHVNPDTETMNALRLIHKAKLKTTLMDHVERKRLIHDIIMTNNKNK